MGEYNPDRPYVLGMQWAPMVKAPLVLDTASEVGYTFRTATEQVDRVWLRSTSTPPGRPTRTELLVNLYQADVIAGTGPVRKLVIPCASGALLAGAALAGSATSVENAVANPSDPRHIALTGPGAAARFWFATTGAAAQAALFRRRILDVSVLYVMSGPFADLAEPVTLGLERPSAGVVWPMDETLTGPALHEAATEVRRSRLGELNPWWSTAVTPLTTKWRMPYNWAGQASPTSGLTAWAASGGTNINVRLQVAGSALEDAVFHVHYLALEVTYGEENRLGGGGLDISEGAGQQGGAYYEIPLFGMYNYGFPVSMRRGARYAVTVGRAHSGQLSVASTVPVPVDRLGTVDALPSLRGVQLRKTIREGAVPSMETVNDLPAIVLYEGSPLPGDADSRSHVYLAQAIGTVSERFFGGDLMQRIIDDKAGTYVWVRFYARHLPGTREPLYLYQADPADPWMSLGPRATISVDEFEMLPEVADGWREVTLRLDPPLETAGGGGVLWWAFASSAEDEAPWQVLGADAEPGSGGPSTISDATYGGAEAFATIDDADDRSADLTLMLIREMDEVTGLVVQPAVQPLAVVDDQCDRPSGGIPTGIRYHRLAWNAVNSEVVAGWGAYEVQRQDDTMDDEAWETIALVAAPNVTAVDDYEARVGVESRYRVRMVHRIGVPGPWSAPVAATIPAPGVTGTRVDVGALILTSNHNPAGNLAYVTNQDRNAGEDFTFPEARDVELRAMYGRDYRAAFRPLERGGVEFTRTVLVNAVAVPAQTLDRGFRSLRDLAWDQVPYVCVRDELDNRWLATLLVPSGSVRRKRQRGQMQLAQVTVVEVADTPEPVDGGPAPCEGLRPEGHTTQVYAAADTPADVGWNPLAADDQFEREVPAGGFGSTDIPGDPWAVVSGPPEDLSVTGGVGVIQLAEPLNANPYFETDVAGWEPTGGTFVRSTEHAHEGVASGLLTPSGEDGFVFVECEPGPETVPGTTWRFAAWVRCDVSRDVVLSLYWFDDDGDLLDLDESDPVTVPANTWVQLSFSWTAPEDTAQVAGDVYMPDEAPPSHRLFIDEAGITPEPVDRKVVTGPAVRDVEVHARVRITRPPGGEPINAYLHGRHVDEQNGYTARLAFVPDGTVGVGLEMLHDGEPIVLAELETARDWQGEEVPVGVGDWYWFRMQVRGQVVRASVWKDEPGSYWPGWTVQELDGTLPAAGLAGVGAGLSPGN
ncbi:carbohydrate binding domain-containing protein, partial [Micromonospora endophytica]